MEARDQFRASFPRNATNLLETLAWRYCLYFIYTYVPSIFKQLTWYLYIILLFIDLPLFLNILHCFMHVCIYVRVCVCILMCAQVYVYVQVWVYAYMHVHVYGGQRSSSGVIFQEWLLCPLKQGFSLAWNFLIRLHSPISHRKPSAFASLVMRLPCLFHGF